MEEQIYTVTALNEEIKRLLETELTSVWVEGEVSSLRQPPSGHLYFNLKDAHSQIKVVFFRRSTVNINFPLKDGQLVLIFGRISTYSLKSEYQLLGEKIEPKGIGALQIAFEELKKRLAAEGLFASERKKPISYLIKKLGIVTSPSGAAIRDILKVLRRRNPSIEVIIYPALVQGKEAVGEIVRGIEELNRLGGLDAILLTRGGGSLEDLWAFNEEAVARAIAASVIPIISAVGHEVDYTISDFVADLRAPTPSAAAEILSLQREEMMEKVSTYRQRLIYLMQVKITQEKTKLEALKKRYGFQRPSDLLLTLSQRIDDLSDRIIRAEAIRLDRLRQRWEALNRNLTHLSPLAVLERGYSITFTHPEGLVVKDAKTLKAGQLLTTRLAKGKVNSRVEKEGAEKQKRAKKQKKEISKKGSDNQSLLPL